jgi:hypothetical protein
MPRIRCIANGEAQVDVIQTLKQRIIASYFYFLLLALTAKLNIIPLLMSALKFVRSVSIECF